MHSICLIYLFVYFNLISCFYQKIEEKLDLKTRHKNSKKKKSKIKEKNPRKAKSNKKRYVYIRKPKDKKQRKKGKLNKTQNRSNNICFTFYHCQVA